MTKQIFGVDVLFFFHATGSLLPYVNFWILVGVFHKKFCWICLNILNKIKQNIIKYSKLKLWTRDYNVSMRHKSSLVGCFQTKQYWNERDTFIYILNTFNFFKLYKKNTQMMNIFLVRCLINLLTNKKPPFNYKWSWIS